MTWFSSLRGVTKLSEFPIVEMYEKDFPFSYPHVALVGDRHLGLKWLREEEQELLSKEIKCEYCEIPVLYKNTHPKLRGYLRPFIVFKNPPFDANDLKIEKYNGCLLVLVAPAAITACPRCQRKIYFEEIWVQIRDNRTHLNGSPDTVKHYGPVDKYLDLNGS